MNHPTRIAHDFLVTFVVMDEDLDTETILR